MNHKLLIIIVLFTSLFVLTNCKTKNETKKELPVQPFPVTANSPATGNTSNAAQNISLPEAALNGQTDEVQKSLERGVNVDTRDEDGRTALMYAAFNGHKEIMEQLIKKGAAVNLTDNFGRTALMFASSGPYPDAVKLLLTNQADPNIADKEEHFTALMYAAAEGQTEIVRILITYKADPKLKDIDGDNALTFAQNNGHPDIVKLLQPFLK